MNGVAFICTGRRTHRPTSLGTWTVSADGAPRRVDLSDEPAEAELFAKGPRRNSQYIARVRAQGVGTAAATFDETCHRCGRTTRVNADRFRVLLSGLVQYGIQEIDVSTADLAALDLSR